MKRKIYRLMTMIIALVILLSLLAGCADNTTTPSTTKELKVIRVAVQGTGTGIPMYYIQKNGLDVANGFKLEFSTFSSGAPMNEAMGAGLWDVGTIGAAYVRSVVAYDAIAIFEHYSPASQITAVVRPDSPIATVKGYNPDYPEVYGSPDTVRGATILVPVTSGHHQLILKWLGIIGLTEDDVTLVHMDFAQGNAAFTSGEGDIYASFFPFTTPLLDDGCIQVATMATVKSPYYDALITTQDFYAKNKDLLVDLVEQVIVANTALMKDKELYADYIMKWYNINGRNITDKEVVRSEAMNNPLTDLTAAKASPLGEGIRYAATFFRDNAIISDEELLKFNTGNNVKSDVLEEALKRFK